MSSREPELMEIMILIISRAGIFTAFSLYKNGQELLRTDRRRGSISCLDGLRFISICWIIYGHTYYMEVVNIQMDLTQIPHVSYTILILYLILRENWLEKHHVSLFSSTYVIEFIRRVIKLLNTIKSHVVLS